MIIASICKRPQIVLHFQDTSRSGKIMPPSFRWFYLSAQGMLPLNLMSHVRSGMSTQSCQKKLWTNAWGSKKRLDMISRPTRPKFSCPKYIPRRIPFLIFLLLVWLTFQSKVPTSKIQIEEKFLQQLNSKCLENDNSSCVMAKLLSYMNKMLKKPSFSIGKRITLLQTRSVWLFHFHRSLD